MLIDKIKIINKAIKLIKQKIIKINKNKYYTKNY